MLIGLTVADLPVILWCRLKNTLNYPQSGLDVILSLATKVIVDTQGEDPEMAFKVLEKWRSAGTPFRRSRMDPPDALARTSRPDVRKSCEQRQAYRISIPSKSLTRMSGLALQCSTWLAGSRRRYNARVSLTKTQGYGPGLHRITLRSDSEKIELERTSAECVTLHSNKGLQRKYTLAESNLYTPGE